MARPRATSMYGKCFDALGSVSAGNLSPSERKHSTQQQEPRDITGNHGQQWMLSSARPFNVEAKYTTASIRHRQHIRSSTITGLLAVQWAAVLPDSADVPGNCFGVPRFAFLVHTSRETAPVNAKKKGQTSRFLCACYCLTDQPSIEIY